MTRLRKIQITLWALAFVAGTGLSVVVFTPPEEIVDLGRGSNYPDIGGPFELTTHNGERLSTLSLRGRPYLVFFGFTFCPEVCPTTLGNLSVLYDTLGSAGDQITTVFVTVDPERDTQEALASYMEAFDQRIVAARGTPDETRLTLRAFKAYAEKVLLKDGGYTMDHTAIVYMMNRSGQFVGTLDPHEESTVQLAKLRRLLEGKGA